MSSTSQHDAVTTLEENTPIAKSSSLKKPAPKNIIKTTENVGVETEITSPPVPSHTGSHQQQQQQHFGSQDTQVNQITQVPAVHTEMLPPELRDLFEISSFIAHAKPSTKPCFRTRSYVSKDSWMGALYRRLHGESAMLGALQIQRIAERLSSSLYAYQGKIWEQTIRSHLTDFLKGVRVIEETYSDYTEVTPIFKTSILTIEHSLSLGGNQPAAATQGFVVSPGISPQIK